MHEMLWKIYYSLSILPILLYVLQLNFLTFVGFMKLFYCWKNILKLFLLVCYPLVNNVHAYTWFGWLIVFVTVSTYMFLSVSHAEFKNKDSSYDFCYDIVLNKWFEVGFQFVSPFVVLLCIMMF